MEANCGFCSVSVETNWMWAAQPLHLCHRLNLQLLDSEKPLCFLLLHSFSSLLILCWAAYMNVCVRHEDVACLPWRVCLRYCLCDGNKEHRCFIVCIQVVLWLNLYRVISLCAMSSFPASTWNTRALLLLSCFSNSVGKVRFKYVLFSCASVDISIVIAHYITGGTENVLYFYWRYLMKVLSLPLCLFRTCVTTILSHDSWTIV